MLNNRKVKITKIFTFEMGHALLNHDGDCRSIHGHSYKLYVTVRGEPMQMSGHPKDGMVIDFKVLKKIIGERIIEVYDHAMVLNENSPPEMVNSLKKFSGKLVLTPFQPTNENLVLEFAKNIELALPEKVTLDRLKLYETATSYAEWENQE